MSIYQEKPDQSLNDKINEIEDEIRITPYHKGTEHHIGKLRSRIARLKDKIIESSHKGGSGREGYTVKKHGDATVVLVGPPSVGKSTLINKLTNAQSKVASYEFTTLNVIPGMMEYKDARIQIMDIPGIIEGAEKGKGRGKEVLSVIRGSDLIIIMLEPNKINLLESILTSLRNNGIRINEKRPNIKFEKTLSGGIIIHSNYKQDLSLATIKEIISEMGYKNAEITLNEKVTIDSLIDALSKNRAFLPTLFLINKIDQFKNIRFRNIENYHPILISAEKEIGLEELKEKIWKTLKFVRVYLVRPKEEPSMKNPMIMNVGNTLWDLVIKIGEDFSQKKDHAQIWGTGAKFPEQEVSLQTIVQEGMQVRFI